VQNRVHQARVAVAVEREAAGEHLVEHGAERPEVRSAIGLVAANLLGRHVSDGAERRPAAREPVAAAELGQAEVEDLHETVASHEQVRRLDVAVHDPGLVSFVQPVGRLHRDVQRAFDAKRAAREQVP